MMQQFFEWIRANPTQPYSLALAPPSLASHRHNCSLGPAPSCGRWVAPELCKEQRRVVSNY